MWEGGKRKWSTDKPARSYCVIGGGDALAEKSESIFSRSFNTVIPFIDIPHIQHCQRTMMGSSRGVPANDGILDDGGGFYDMV